MLGVNVPTPIFNHPPQAIEAVRLLHFYYYYYYVVYLASTSTIKLKHFLLGVVAQQNQKVIPVKLGRKWAKQVCKLLSFS